MLRGEVIAIGDELTTGQRLDTNSQWLSERLTEMGVAVVFHTTVADDLLANIEAFRAAAQRADVVVSTGGLGPTADDLTREALAAAAEVELVEDAESLAHIENLFRSRGRGMPERNRLQAQFPRGANPIPNPHGTAPGIEQTIGGCRIFALPGVPAEMYEMWRASVAPAIAALQESPRVIRHRRIKCFGVGESQLEAMLPDVIARGREPQVGITVSGATITLRITAAGANEAACFDAMAPTEKLIREQLGLLVFGDEEDELEQIVLRLLSERNQTLAVGECATNGTLSAWLAAADTSGRFVSGQFRRGEGAMREIPAVEGAAEILRERTGADYALGVGEVCEDQVVVALAHPEGVRSKSFPTLGHPAIMVPRMAKQALNMLRLHLVAGSGAHQ
jgi:nicotinamide-nucleotide amidase